MPESEVDWIVPGQHGAPAEVLLRIQALCQQVPDLFSLMLALLATHQGLPREILAVATKQCRNDLQDLSREDVTGLYTGILNGGRQGFDAVLRAKRKGEKRSGGLSWVKE
jgi:hypothetical protein